MGFQTPQYKIGTLLEWAAAGKVQLPDFQRSWVWDEERICSLIASISQSFPVGALMTLAIENQLAWQIPFAPDVPVTLATFLATLTIGVIAALYPSWRASRQRLIELVGYE